MRHTSTLIALALLFSSPLEEAVLTIVAIGASNTSGWRVGSQNAYHAQLQTILRKKGSQATVTNAGVLGDTTAGMLRSLDSAVPKGTNIVILQPGANDLRFGFSKEQRAAKIAEMVKRLRARDGAGCFRGHRWCGVASPASSHNCRNCCLSIAIGRVGPTGVRGNHISATSAGADAA